MNFKAYERAQKMSRIQEKVKNFKKSDAYKNYNSEVPKEKRAKTPITSWNLNEQEIEDWIIEINDFTTKVQSNIEYQKKSTIECLKLSKIMESKPILNQDDRKVFSTLQFEALPNEVIFHIFSYLKIEELLRCGQVSKRFRAISDDQYLWPKKLNLYNKKVPVGFLQRLLESGCKYLSLSFAISEGTLNLQKASRLKYLNLSNFKNREDSEKLLESSYSLQKLSLSNFYLSSKLISIISLQNGKTLTVLDLSECTLCQDKNNLDCARYTKYYCAYTESIQQIVEHCTELKELSLHKTKLCEKSVDILLSNLTSTIEKLDLFDMSFLRDEHVKKLVTRCKKITELNLGGWGTSITKQSLNFIFEHLQLTLEKLTMKFTKAKFDSYNGLLKLKRMVKLTIFCYDLCYSDYRLLKEELPNLWVHSDQTIAIPWNKENNDCQALWEIKAKREELFNDYFCPK